VQLFKKGALSEFLIFFLKKTIPSFSPCFDELIHQQFLKMKSASEIGLAEIGKNAYINPCLRIYPEKNIIFGPAIKNYQKSGRKKFFIRR
jgi:hypothetical protein